MKKYVAEILVISLCLIASSIQAQEASLTSPDRRLYVIGTSHLDTQWRWTVQKSIEEYIPATFRENYKLFEAFPDYTFSFEGAFRYMLMKEYYPAEYEKVKPYVASGQWRVAGSWVDAVDTNVPSPESLIRQALYGNGFFKQEFGKTSTDVFLPDCFGFGYALPSIAAHCGIKGFSTQKLTWGSSVGVPFDIGLWEGVDGSTLVAELNPGDYVARVRGDLSRDTTWIKTIDHQGDTSGLYAGFKYFGTGDTGGAPDSESVAWVQKSIHSDGPLKVISTGSDELAKLLTGEQKANLPRYKGELLMTRHGVGCYTSQAAMKRWNRKNELLADATERACVIADQLGYPYPQEELRNTWIRFLWHQFHDDLTGTSIPEAYQFSWNDELWASNRFAGLLEDAVAATASAMDTRVKGVPLVVYNPLSLWRQDIVEANVVFPGKAPAAVRVFHSTGLEAPSQLVGRSGDTLKVIFLAQAPSVGYAVFDVRPADKPYGPTTDLKISMTSMENSHYRVTLDGEGNVAAIFDKYAGHEMLGQPLGLQLLDDSPKRWPSWEIDSTTVWNPPREAAGEQAQVRIVESGPVRVALEIARKIGKSTFVQTIRLATGTAGDRVNFDTWIDWQEKATLLKAVFPLAVSNDSVTYDLGLGDIKRGKNTGKKYEVPGQKWADLTSADGNYGIAVLNDCKYGWDHPDSATLRLSLIHTPGISEGWGWVGDQGSQDLGQHRITYALQGHQGDWRHGVAWEAECLNQSLLAFQTVRHAGILGRRYSLVSLSTDPWRSDSHPLVAVKTIKAAENSSELVVRLQELGGRPVKDALVGFNQPLVTAREINGVEEPLDSAHVVNGVLEISFKPFQLRTFAVKFAESEKLVVAPSFVPLKLPYNLDGASYDGEKGGGDCDGRGVNLPAELLLDTLYVRGTTFITGPKGSDQANLVRCEGQKLFLAKGDFNRVDLLICATGNQPVEAVFSMKGREQSFWIPVGSQWIGQWNNRLVGDSLMEEPEGIAPAFVNHTPLGWTATHTHHTQGENIAYKYANFYLVRLDLPKKAKNLTLPLDNRLRILAASLVKSDIPTVLPTQALYDDFDATLTALHPLRQNFIDSTVVEISSPIPGAEIRYTLDGSDPTPQSASYTHPFTLNNTTTIKSRAFKQWMNSDYVAATKVYKHTPIPAVDIPAPKEGLQCYYYETDSARESVVGIDSLKMIREKTVKAFAIPSFACAEFYALKFTGFVQVPQDGMYRFSTYSDDGSALYVRDRFVVNNDGLHGPWEESGEIALKAGWHPIMVVMFQGRGGKALEVFVEGPGQPKEVIPANRLAREEK